MEVSDEESGTDDSGITDDRITNNRINSNKEKECGVVCDGSTDKSTNKGTSESEVKQQESALSFLEQLDARIKSSKMESEKLR